MSKSINGVDYIGTMTSSGSEDFVGRIYEIGAWDMLTTPNKSFTHGLSATEWKNVISMEGRINNDTVNIFNTLYGGGSRTWPVNQEPAEAFVWYIDATNIYLARKSTGTFINTQYSSTSLSRGIVTIRYKKD